MHFAEMCQGKLESSEMSAKESRMSSKRGEMGKRSLDDWLSTLQHMRYLLIGGSTEWQKSLCPLDCFPVVATSWRHGGRTPANRYTYNEIHDGMLLTLSFRTTSQTTVTRHALRGCGKDDRVLRTERLHNERLHVFTDR